MAEKVMVSSLCWVPRGCSAQFPTSCVLEEQNVEDLLQQQQQQLSSSNSSAKEQRRKQQQLLKQQAAAEDGESDADSGAEMLEDEDSDNADEAEDDEANIILDTDLVLVAAAAERDFSSLEVYVHDMERGSLYVHHDLMCGGFPLCLEWLSLLPGSRPRNLVAVGGFDPLIQIWDLDVLDALEPVHTLGLQQQQQEGGDSKSRKKSKKRDKSNKSADAHEGPVMSLSTSPLKEEALASGSADETAKVWDLSTGSCLATYKHHDNKVQVVLWHPTEASLLVTASYDRTVRLLDVRQPDTANLIVCLSFNFVSASAGRIRSYNSHSMNLMASERGRWFGRVPGPSSGNILIIKGSCSSSPAFVEDSSTHSSNNGVAAAATAAKFISELRLGRDGKGLGLTTDEFRDEWARSPS
ncbi:hypothetical protein Emag_002836 [Eimeria magna]